MTILAPRLISIALMITACVNLTAGLAGMLFPDLNAQIMIGPDVSLDGLTLRYHHTIWAFVASMGVGYAIASRNPEAQTGLLAAGGVGKLAIVVIWCEMLYSGHGAWPLLGGIVFDGAMGLLFLAFVTPRIFRQGESPSNAQ